MISQGFDVVLAVPARAPMIRIGCRSPSFCRNRTLLIANSRNSALNSSNSYTIPMGPRRRTTAAHLPTVCHETAIQWPAPAIPSVSPCKSGNDFEEPTMTQKCSRCGRTLECHCNRGCSRCTSGFVCPTHGKDWVYRTGGGFFSSGASGSGAKCRKCGRPTTNCQYCHGRSGRTCSACGGTGQICTQHGRYWK